MTQGGLSSFPAGRGPAATGPSALFDLEVSAERLRHRGACLCAGQASDSL